jgi:surfactin family lipopeptide synthetase B
MNESDTPMTERNHPPADERIDAVLPHAWPFPGCQTACPWTLTESTSRWVARVAGGQVHAELAVLAALVCSNLACFSGRRRFTVLLADGLDEAVGLGGVAYEYVHDTGREFAAVARDIAAAIEQRWTSLGDAAEQARAAEVAIGVRTPDTLLLDKPLVMAFERTGDIVCARVHGARREQLRTWVGWFWDSLSHQASLVAEDPRLPLARLDLLPPNQRKALLAVNSTAVAYRDDMNVAELFLEQAASHADEIAVFGTQRNYTWAELSDCAARLAAWLMDRHDVQGKVVAVVTERHELSVVAFLGIAMAGGIYLPVSSEYPIERMRYVLRDSAAVLAIAIDEVPELADVAVPWRSIPLESAAPVLPVSRRGDDPLYVIYTSGSTGQPKGVCVSHRNVLRLTGPTSYVDWQAGDRIALAATPIFDAITFEMWGGLLNGLALVCVPKSVFLDPDQLEQLLEERRVTLAFVSTALFNHVASRRATVFGKLRCLLFGGEVAAINLVRQVRQANPGLRLHHVYGPTENTTFSTCHPVQEVGDRLPIGRPIGNSTAWVVDELLRPLPIGASGQLLVGGDGVASGYLNAPELTARRFVTAPGELQAGLRPCAYLSGDWARWTPEHTIDFLGRLDNQVKVQGYRVELDEIRMRLAQFPGVTEVEVLPGERLLDQGYKSVHAYFCAEQPIEPTTLRRHMADAMPPYMVPSKFVRLRQLPLTLQGKVDKAALVNLEGEADAPVACDARHETDRRLLAIWRDLLGTRLIRIDDLFASVGGHSMLLLDLAKRIFDEFAVELELTELVRCPTIRQLADRLLREQGSSRVVAAPEGGSGDFALLPTQLQMFLGQQMAPQSATYHIPLLLRLDGALDAERLQRAWADVIHANDALRTSFHVSGKAVVQRIEPHVDNPLTVGRVAAADLQPHVSRASRMPFDLSRPYNVRAELLIVDEARAYLLLACHHIVIDGIGLEALLAELTQRYAGNTPPAPVIGWREAVEWTVAEVGAAGADVEHFCAHLRGSNTAVTLSHLAPVHPRGDPGLAGIETSAMPAPLRQALEGYSRSRGVTPSVALLGGFCLLLWRYSGSSDMNVGMPVSGRWRFPLARSVGMFVNTVVLRARWEEDHTFDDVVAALAEVHRDALAHERAPLDAVAQSMGLQAHRLFNVMFNMQSLAMRHIAFGESIEACVEPVEWNAAKYDVALRVQDDGCDYMLGLEYRQSVLTQALASEFLQRLTALLQHAFDQPSARVVDTVEASERACQPLVVPRAVARPTSTGTLPARFQWHVVSTPERVALSDESEVLSYAALHARAAAIAERLTAEGVRRGDTVAVCLPRSANTVAAMLACWHVGAAFLSLDKEWQLQRLNDCCEAAAVRAIVTEASTRTFHAAPRILIDDVLAHDIVVSPRSMPAAAALTAEDCAYVIFTSGSTGTPKGVPISHGNLANYAGWFERFGRLTSDDRAGVLTSLSFDLSYTSLWPLLYAGASAHVAPAMPLVDADAVVEFMARRCLSCLKLTPSLLNVLLPALGKQAAHLTALRLVVLGGEPPRRGDVRRLRALLPGLDVVNHYGPTETTVGCAAMYLDSTTLNDSDGPVPVGQPIDNMVAFVLDEAGRPVRDGVVGELCLAGAGVSRGYLGADAKRDERFFVDRTLDEKPLYRTGDAAYRDGAGRLVLQGRIDRQTKVRGYRIELAEVERMAERLPGVERAAAIAVSNPQGDAELCLFCQGSKPRMPSLRQRMAELFPDFMVPTYLRQVAELPITHNGKVDYDALRHLFAAGDVGAGTPSAAPAEPGVLVELGDIWFALTGVRAVASDTPLFEAGGNSLQILRLFAELKTRFGERVSLPEIFSNATLGGVAALLEARAPKAVESCDRFSSSARTLHRFAQRHGIHADAVLAGLFAQALYEHAPGDAVSFVLCRGGERRGLTVDFSQHEHVEDLLADVDAQLLADPRNLDERAGGEGPQWALQLGEADAELLGGRFAIALRVSNDGVSGEAYAPSSNCIESAVAVSRRMSHMLNQLQ